MSDEKVTREMIDAAGFDSGKGSDELAELGHMLWLLCHLGCEIRDLLEPREESVPTPAASENVSFCSDVRPRYWMVGTLDSGVMGRALPDGESEVMEPTTAVDLLNELSEPAASDAGEGEAFEGGSLDLERGFVALGPNATLDDVDKAIRWLEMMKAQCNP